MADKNSDTLAPAGELVIENVDGRMDELEGTRQEFSLLIHDETRQAFPIPPMVPVFTPSLEGPYCHLLQEIYYFDTEIPNPDADPSMVFEVAEAACIAAERGELQEDQEQAHKSRITFIAALGGIIFPIAMSCVSSSMYG